MKKIFIILFITALLLGACVSTGAPKEDSKGVMVVNNTPYEMQYLYAVSIGYEENWGENLIEAEPLAPYASMELNLAEGDYNLVAEFLVDDSYVTVENNLYVEKGKAYEWKIEEDSMTYSGGGYDYLDNPYDYMDDDYSDYDY